MSTPSRQSPVEDSLQLKQQAFNRGGSQCVQSTKTINQDTVKHTTLTKCKYIFSVNGQIMVHCKDFF